MLPGINTSQCKAANVFGSSLRLSLYARLHNGVHACTSTYGCAHACMPCDVRTYTYACHCVGVRSPIYKAMHVYSIVVHAIRGHRAIRGHIHHTKVATLSIYRHPSICIYMTTSLQLPEDPTTNTLGQQA